MTNEQLLMMSQLATELYNARLEIDTLKRDRKADETKREESERKLASLAFVRKSAEDNGRMYADERAAHTETKRKFGALCRVCNCANVDPYRLRHPRVFLKEYIDVLKKCIADNDIHLNSEGGAQ